MLSLSWNTLVIAFMAAAVEWVEAFTVVLAVSTTIGWRRAATAAALALLLLGTLTILTHGATSAALHLPGLRLAVGVFLLLFGLRWFTKAVARMAGLRPLHDEARVFAQTQAQMAHAEGRAASALAFNAVLLEGLEVWLIVAALGSVPEHALSAALGAVLALVTVTIAGLILRGPLTRVPENTLKFIVACALLTLGTFWSAEALSPAAWPWGDLAPLAVFVAYAVGGWVLAARLRPQVPHGARP